MLENLGNLYGDLKELTQRRISILMFLLLLGINQLIYSSVPLALVLNLLLLGGALHLYNARFSSEYRRHVILVCVFILVTYVFSLFSHAQYLLLSLFSLSLLWISMNGILYLMGGEPFLENFIAGLLQLLRASLYFGILYGIIYLISYLFNQIFFLSLPYDGVVFRLANSLSTMAGLLVLFAGKRETKPGNFFNLLFGKLLPKLSMLFGTLALIYSIQALLGYVEAYPPFVFYSLGLLFYLGFILSHQAGMKEGEEKVLLLLFFGLSLLFLLIRINISGNLVRMSRGRSFYHEIFLLASFSLLQLFLLLKKELSSIRIYVLLLILVLFLPPFGMLIHAEYSLRDIVVVSPYSEWEMFKNKKLPSQQGDLEQMEVYQYNDDLGNFLSREYDIEAYSHLVELSWSKEFYKAYRYKEIELSLEDQGKKLVLEEGDKKEILNLSEEVKLQKTGKPWIYERGKVKLVILRYYQSGGYYSLEFKAFFKE